MDELSQYQYRINNVKLSIIFLSKLRIEEFRSNLLEKWKNEVSFSKNIIIIQSKYTCTIFHKSPGKYHVNLTKVSSLDDIKGSLDYVITKYFSPLKFHLIKHKIDNISASLSLNRFISLHYLAVHSRHIRFNPERFSGGIFKFQDHRGTVIIFTSGCVNILGCKNEEQILRLWKKLTSTLASLAV